MKHYLFTLLACLAFVTLQAQNCLNYYPWQKGETFEITHFDKKEKESMRFEYLVLERTATEAVLRGESFDMKGKSSGIVEFSLECEGSDMKIDMRNFMPTSSMQQLQSLDNATIEFEGIDMVFPNQLRAGMTLPDSYFQMKAAVSGVTVLTTSVEITNRKVEGKETITTPLGSFDCFKVTSQSHTKAGFVKLETTEALFLHPQEGFIRSESYDKKGRLSGYQVRTK